MNSNFRTSQFLILSGVLLTLLFVVNIMLGSVKIPFTEVLSILAGQHPDSTWYDIVWQFRLPKAATCVLAGTALASGGLMMQSWFRNPLAGPDVLGLSSGASLMVALLILAGASNSLLLQLISNSSWGIALAASIGSLLVFMLVIVLAQKVKNNASLLIIGLMTAATTSSLVSVLQFLSPADELQAFMIWTMGSVGGTGWPEIRVMTLVILVGVVISTASLKSLNALLLGEHYAQSLGIRVKRARFFIVLATSIMTGVVTAFCGPIAFVGLAVPHLIRIMVPSANHKVLLPAVMMGGASLILLCDILSQLPGRTQVLPLNAMTSFIGAPVVIWVVMRSRTVAG